MNRPRSSDRPRNVSPPTSSFPCHQKNLLRQQPRRAGGNGCRRIIEIDFACLDLTYQFFRQRIRIHFQSYGESCLRTHPLSHAAILFAGDSFVELEGIPPEGLAAKCIEAKDLSPLLDHFLCVRIDRAVVFREFFRGTFRSCFGLIGGTESRANQKTQSNQKSTE